MSEAGQPRRRGALALLVASGLLLVLLLLLCGAWLAWPALAPAPTPLPLEDESAWRASALANAAAGPYSELWPHLVVERGSLPRSIRARAAEEEEPGTSALHRAFQRSYFKLEPALAPPSGFAGPYLRSVYPGSLPEEGPLLTCVGVWVRSEPQGAVYEVLAYTLAEGPEGARWVFGPPRARNLHAGSLRARRAAGELFEPLR